jgi:hypothetical protein
MLRGKVLSVAIVQLVFLGCFAVPAARADWTMNLVYAEDKVSGGSNVDFPDGTTVLAVTFQNTGHDVNGYHVKITVTGGLSSTSPDNITDLYLAFSTDSVAGSAVVTDLNFSQQSGSPTLDVSTSSNGFNNDGAGAFGIHLENNSKTTKFHNQTLVFDVTASGYFQASDFEVSNNKVSDGYFASAKIHVSNSSDLVLGADVADVSVDTGGQEIAVPAPSSIVLGLAGIGLFGLIGVRRYRRWPAVIA